MENLTTIEKLDIILDYLYENDKQAYDTVKITNDLTQIDEYQVRRLLNVLKEDGYAINTTIWGLSVNGYILKESGGIKALILQRKNELQYYEDEKIRRAMVDSDMVTNARRLNRITFWLLLVTAFVGLIALATCVLPYILCPVKCPK